MEDLLVNLQTGWKQLVSVSHRWLTHLESKLAGSDKEKKHARELIANKKSTLTSYDQLLQQASPATIADRRDVATTVKTYLQVTETRHTELAELSKADPDAAQYAVEVQKRRVALMEQVRVIHGTTLVHYATPSGPPAGASPPPAPPGSGSPGGGSASSRVATPALGGANHVSNLFLDTMTCLKDHPISTPNVVTQALFDITQQFFDNESFSSNVTYALSDDDINALTQSWSAVVAVFADPANASTSCASNLDDPVQLESDLFLIHDQLDTLYDHLETDVTRTDESILSISI